MRVHIPLVAALLIGTLGFVPTTQKVPPAPRLYVAIAMALNPPMKGLPEFYTPREAYPSFSEQYHRMYGGFETNSGPGLSPMTFGTLPPIHYEWGFGDPRPYTNARPVSPKTGMLLGAAVQSPDRYCLAQDQITRKNYGEPFRGSVAEWDGIIVGLFRSYKAGCYFSFHPRSPEDRSVLEDDRIRRPSTYPTIPPEIRPTYAKTWGQAGHQAFLGATLSDMDRAVDEADLPSPWRERLTQSLRTFVAQRQAWRRFEESGMVAAWEATWR